MPKVLNSIKMALIGKGRSQLWLARELEVNPNTITNWCLNKNQPHLEQLGKIARVLDVNIKDLIADGTSDADSSVD